MSFLINQAVMQSMYIPDPVLSVAMKPKLPKDLEVFTKAITRFQKQVYLPL